jgi:hypothetical protein
MRNRLFPFILILLGFAAASPALAQTPPDQLIQGQVQGVRATNNNGVYCYLTTGVSQLQMGSGVPATGVISFPEIAYWDGAYHDLSGQARLVFTSSTAGLIRFKLWPKTGYSDPAFSGFVSTAYAGGQYVVTFNILFPNSCTLSIYGNYETP